MKTILIAEDNDSNYRLMTFILRNQYNCLRAHNGQEAVELARTEKPDMVFMDLKMPVMDGLEATKKIKASNPTLPVVALTANAFDTDREAAMEAGCDDFLSKPVSGQKCLEAIIKHTK